MKDRWVVWIFSLLTFFAIINSGFAADNTTEILSMNNNSIQGNMGSFDGVVSTDGRFIAFSSNADNLVAKDANNCWDIFVRDRFLNLTERVSVSSSGQEGNGDSFDPSINADGLYITFTSYASNLIQNNNCTGQPYQLFRHDRLLGITQIVSVSVSGEIGDGDSQGSSISSDGRYVAFTSSASNLIGGDTNGSSDVFVRDMLLLTTERISLSSEGVQGDHESYWKPALSGDARFVAFVSWSSNLVADDGDMWSDIFLHDRNLRTTTRVTHQYHWDEGGPFRPELSLSYDGRYLAFISRAFLIESIINYPNYWSFYYPTIFVYERFIWGYKHGKCF